MVKRKAKEEARQKLRQTFSTNEFEFAAELAKANGSNEIRFGEFLQLSLLRMGVISKKRLSEVALSLVNILSL